MKRILITGANSYVGTSFENYVKQWPDKYQVDTISLYGEAWREKSFAGYDVILHVAGIAHVKETRKNAHLYFQVNRDLAIETANKAKRDGVKQFIFLSSMSVYGMETGVINRNTIPYPKSNYGKSKLEAEKEINKLSDQLFYVAIVRPPMIYGKNCRGNFRLLIQAIDKTPVFPLCQNQRSMIYIKNFCSFLIYIIENRSTNIYLPQNLEYMQTSQMAYWISKARGKSIHMSVLIGFLVRILRIFLPIAKKSFGTLIYKDREGIEELYCMYNLEKSIEESVKY